MCKESDPCYMCERRHVTSDYNCHSNCPDYKAYKQAREERAKVIYKKRAEEAMVTNVLVKAAEKTIREKGKR
jgi:hypothetical protein